MEGVVDTNVQIAFVYLRGGVLPLLDRSNPLLAGCEFVREGSDIQLRNDPALRRSETWLRPRTRKAMQAERGQRRRQDFEDGDRLRLGMFGAGLGMTQGSLSLK